MNTNRILSNYLSEDDKAKIGEAIVTGYKACDDFMQSNVVSKGFLTMMDKRSRLITPFVEHALSLIDGFNYEFKPNNANNCWHQRLYKGKLAMTTHFLGKDGDRKVPKKALHRAVLAGRNYDLFAHEDKTIDISNDHAYSWILHAGFLKPKFAALAIPTRDQLSISGSVVELPLLEADLEKVEIIREKEIIQLLTAHENIKKQNN